MKRIKKWYNKFVSLWQSKNEKFKDIYYGSIALLLIMCFCLFLYKAMRSGNEMLDYIAKILFGYSALAILFIAIMLYLLYWYIYNKRIENKFWKHFITVVILLIIIVGMIVLIPFFIFISILDSIISYRAKRMDNFIGFLWGLSLMFFILTVVSPFTFVFTELIARYMKGIINYVVLNVLAFGTDTSMVYNDLALKMFIFLILLHMEIYLSLKISLSFVKKNRVKLNKKRLKNLKEELDNNFHKDTDLKKHINHKEEKLNRSYEKFEKEIDYDLNYYKNSIRRLELGILILIFLIFVFDIYPLELKLEALKYEADVLNVITVYTLAMLFIDKSKEWE